uniref:Uncharacterized protein n=1 Tax=Anguilla anguilla TaxID=7936 RepID=A0A0E9S1Q5_ANGAN
MMHASQRDSCKLQRDSEDEGVVTGVTPLNMAYDIQNGKQWLCDGSIATTTPQGPSFFQMMTVKDMIKVEGDSRSDSLSVWGPLSAPAQVQGQ